MSHDDDYLTAAVPEPLAEASPSERVHAKRFADVVDKALVGRTPAAMSADDRALLEVATVIRATSGRAELASERGRSIVDDVLMAAIGEPRHRTRAPAARRQAPTWAPWLVAGASTLVAAAAVIALWLRGPAPQPRTVDTGAHAGNLAAVPFTWTSRPVDVGPIARDKSGAAAERIDYLFADRLDGFRERRLNGPGGVQ